MSEPDKGPDSIGRSFVHQLEDLLAGEVTGELTKDEKTRLEAIVASADAQTLRQIDRQRRSLQETADLVALAADLVTSDWDRHPSKSGVPLPVYLADRIRRDASKYLNDDSVHDENFPVLTNQRQTRETNSVPTRRHFVTWAGWCVAAGVSAFMIGNSIIKKSKLEEPVAVMDTAELNFAKFKQEHPHAVEVAWTANNPAELTPSGREGTPDLGSLVWDTQSQKGLMRFRSLPVNDPSERQYQLWIIDPARDDEPVDGGVFDVVGGPETIVEIDAKLQVVEPIGFAITIEQPGGVVVSDQSRMPLLALVSK